LCLSSAEPALLHGTLVPKFLRHKMETQGKEERPALEPDQGAANPSAAEGPACSGAPDSAGSGSNVAAPAKTPGTTGRTSHRGGRSAREGDGDDPNIETLAASTLHATRFHSLLSPCSRSLALSAFRGSLVSRSRRLTGNRWAAPAARLTVRDTCGVALLRVAERVFPAAEELEDFLSQRYVLRWADNPTSTPGSVRFWRG
jgi:hypothetical protein